MKKIKPLLLNNVQLDTETTYQVNGDIDVYACSWNQHVEPVTRETKCSYPARVTVMENGDVTVRAYRIGSNGPRYRKRFATEHCEVLQADGGQLVERWKFPPQLSIHDVWDIRRREQPAVNAYYLTLKENQL